ncbi:hypothetical protein OK016_29300 [Vibrio chagasii]|nr:hypothetical protein [Vibrio chagasii]
MLDPEFGDDEWGPSAGNDSLLITWLWSTLNACSAYRSADNGNYMWVIQVRGCLLPIINGSDAKPTHKNRRW